MYTMTLDAYKQFKSNIFDLITEYGFKGGDLLDPRKHAQVIEDSDRFGGITWIELHSWKGIDSINYFGKIKYDDHYFYVDIIEGNISFVNLVVHYPNTILRLGVAD